MKYIVKFKEPSLFKMRRGLEFWDIIDIKARIANNLVLVTGAPFIRRFIPSITLPILSGTNYKDQIATMSISHPMKKGEK